MRLLRIILTLFTLLTAVITILSAYAGMINPLTWALPSVLAMIFPIMTVVTLALILINLFVCRKASAIGALSLVCCWNPLLTLCPLNFMTPDTGGQPLRLITYNVLQLEDFTGSTGSGEPNPTLRQIAGCGADFVALQECHEIGSLVSVDANRHLLDTIGQIYPYQSYGARGQSLLSRYPFEEITLSEANSDDFRVRAFRIFVDRDTLTLFDVHLQSIGLTSDDKRLYRDLTRGDTQGKGIRSELRDIRTDLISKLTAAFRARAVQAAKLREMIAETGGKCIVCGDFNDVPGCYAIRTLTDTGMLDAWRESAIGPAITYHASRLYFRIDHILYSPEIVTPLRTRSLDWPYSDHYPVEMTFVMHQAPSSSD